MLDYHVHTRYCRHASGEVKEYVIEGMNKGLKEIGISDHYPMSHLPKLSYNDYSMDLQEFPSYKREVNQLKKIFNSKIDVKLGAEVDYLKAEESTLRKNLASEDVDYLMGVIHLLDNWIIDDPRNTHKYLEYDLNAFYNKYFDEIQNLIRSGLFDIVGHIDVIKKFNHIPEEGIERYIMPCLESIADKEKLINHLNLKEIVSRNDNIISYINSFWIVLYTCSRISIFNRNTCCSHFTSSIIKNIVIDFNC